MNEVERVREKLSLVDVGVISILWCIEFVGIWFNVLCAYTSFVFFSSQQQHSRKFKINVLLVFIVQCIGALVISFLVDVGRLRKMTVCVIGVGLFSTTPVVALLTTISSSPWSGMFMFWPCSVLFVTLPATYCLMFNQKLDASFTNVRRLVSVLEMGNALIGWISFVVLPKDLDYSSRRLIVIMWVASIPLLVVLLTLLDIASRFAKGDFTVDNSIKSLVEGIRTDLQEKDHSGRSVNHVIYFTLLLMPALSLSVIGATLDVTSDDFAKPQDPRLVNLLYAFQLLVIPVVEVILAMTHVREDRADYSILTLAHTTNVLVLILIVTNFKPVPVPPVTSASGEEREPLVRIKRGESFDEPLCPKPEQGTYLLLNGVNHDIQVQPSVKLDDKSAPWIIKAGAYSTGSTNATDDGFDIYFYVRSLGDPPKPPDYTSRSVKLYGNLFNFYCITGNDKNFFEFKEYSSTHTEKPGMAEIIIMSSMWLDDRGGQVTITNKDGSHKEVVSVPTLNDVKAVQVPVVVGVPTTFNYEYEGFDETAKKLLNKDSVEINLQDFDDYLVYLVLSSMTPGKALTINAVRVCGNPRPTTAPPPTTSPSSTESPPTPEPTSPPNAQEMTAYALAGCALGVASVAYTHFFWMESPLRLRATMFASFRVANAMVYRFVLLLTGTKLTLAKTYTLLSLQVITTIAHLVLGWIFQTWISHG